SFIFSPILRPQISTLFPYTTLFRSVLDFARNTENLGPVNNPIIPERKKKKKGGGGGAPVRCCPVCLEYNPASVRFCQVCQYEFRSEERRVGKEGRWLWWRAA